MDVFELILQFLTTLSVFAVTMLSFEKIRKKHRLFEYKETLYISLGVMCVSSILLVCVEHYITQNEKEKSAIAQENLNVAQKKINDALEKQNEALQNQLDCQKMSDIKTDNRHSSDSAYYTIQNNKLVGIINGLIHTSKQTLDTTAKTIKEVQKIKTPSIEPYIDLANDPSVKDNPTANYKNDTASFSIHLQNFKDNPAKNIEFICIFINPQTNNTCIAEAPPNWNQNLTVTKDEILNIQFFAIITTGMPNAFYIYFKLIYTDLNNKNNVPFERVYLREYKGLGIVCTDAGETSLQKYTELVYSKYPFLKQ